jgi:hypothetical protein
MLIPPWLVAVIAARNLNACRELQATGFIPEIWSAKLLLVVLLVAGTDGLGDNQYGIVRAARRGWQPWTRTR